jgi:hypothetical protein
MRFLPGNVKSSAISGAHEPKGIWLGYIDRDYFDGNYSPSAGFYGLDTKLIKASPVNYSLGGYQGGEFVATTGTTLRRYYRWSDIYDGIQEGPLSTAILGVDIPTTGIVRGYFDIDEATHNKRITSRKIYRCDTSDGEFLHIHTINYLRKAADVGWVNEPDGAYAGNYAAYIPAAATLNFNAARHYKITLHGTVDSGDSSVTFTAGTLSGTGITEFLTTAVSWDHTDLWDCLYTIYESILGTFVDETVFQNQSFGAFSGSNVVIFDSGIDSTGYGKYVGGVFLMTEPDHATYPYEFSYKGQVIAHYEKALKIAHVFAVPAAVADYQNKDFMLLSLLDGLYCSHETAGVHTYIYYDYNLTGETAHPYQNDLSCTINGQYAQVVNDLLIQGNVLLDPKTTDEYHEDEISYSLLSQLDANPVSRVQRIQDIEGGPVTGLAMSFNSCLIYKKRSKFRLLLNDPSDVTSWEFRESLFNRGNLATNGTIQVGHKVYSVANDGIYEDDISSIVSADDTALINSRISEPINDAILALTDAQKAAVITGYDSVNAEVIFKYSSIIRAFDITRKTWRTIGTALSGITVFGSDHLNGLLGYDALPGGSDMLYTTLQNESVAMGIKTKHFRLNTIRKEILNSLQIIYNSAVALKVNMYFDGAFSTPIALSDLAATSGEISTAKLRIKRRCKSAMLEIKEASASSSAVEIHAVEIYTS